MCALTEFLYQSFITLAFGVTKLQIPSPEAVALLDVIGIYYPVIYLYIYMTHTLVYITTYILLYHITYCIYIT